MYIPLLLGLLSFVLCMIYTPLCRVVALRFDLVDTPDETRKKHASPTPRVGGFAIVLAYATALGLMLLVPPSNEQLHIQHYSLLRVLLPPAILIFLVGLLDDLVTLSALQKLAGQIFGCITAAVLGHFMRQIASRSAERVRSSHTPSSAFPFAPSGWCYARMPST